MREAKFYGLRACDALVSARPEAIHRAFFDERTAPRYGELMRELARRRRPYRVVDDEELAKVAGTQHHEGVCIVADEIPEPDSDAVLRSLASERSARVLFLDGVSNPHNVGALLRTAAHFGPAALAGLEDELSSPSGAAARVAEGAAEHVPVLRWRDPRRSLARFRQQGFARVATVVEGGESLFDVDLPEHCVFLLGAEREGLSDAGRAVADVSVTIPGTGAVESLNVAAACAVLLAEHYRRFPG